MCTHFTIQQKIIYLTNELAYCSESMAEAKGFIEDAPSDCETILFNCENVKIMKQQNYRLQFCKNFLRTSYELLTNFLRTSYDRHFDTGATVIKATRGLQYKTFYCRNLRIFIMS
jgi:hypothetical protein